MLARNQVVMVKLEVSEGTDPSPVEADAIECAELNPGYDFQKLERIAVRNGISALKSVIGRETLSLQIVCELKGSGTKNTAPKWGRLLQACCYTEAVGANDVGYTPTSPSGTFKTVTIYVYKDGMLWKVSAARGNAKIDLPAGQYPTITFTISGVFKGVSDAAVPATPVYESTLPIIVESAGMSFGAFNAAVVRNLSFDTGNTLAERPDVNSAKGLKGYRLTGRDPRYQTVVEAELEATKAFWGGQQARTEEAIDFTHGTVEGNIITLAIPKACTEKITPSNENGILMWQIEGQALENTGNDNITITTK